MPKNRSHAAGPKNPNWKGGRSIRDDGYVLVQIPPDHPFAEMGRNKSRSVTGYHQVYEHRLVMARHLDRPLLTRETVHHIDGDHANNALNNLRLFATGAEHSSHEWQISKQKILTLQEEVARLKAENERLRCQLQLAGNGKGKKSVIKTELPKA